jgi:L,D-transpeptidase catalytic domain
MSAQNGPRIPLSRREWMGRGMKRLRLLAAGLLAVGLACASSSALANTVLIHINKPTQTMTVTVDGQVRYRWPVSTGATGYSTPVGSYTPFRMEVMHYSREWDNAGMPHAIFFTKRGHSIHGSDHPGLGMPVSHGCVRLSLANATMLYQLVQAGGMANTKVAVSGPDPPGFTVPSQPPTQGARPWQPFRFFRF